VTLQLAQVLHSVPFWSSHTRLRCCMLTTRDAAEQQEAELRDMMIRARMVFDMKVVLIEDEPEFTQAISHATKGAKGGDLEVAKKGTMRADTALVSVEAPSDSLTSNKGQDVGVARNLLDISVDVSLKGASTLEAQGSSELPGDDTAPGNDSVPNPASERQPMHETLCYLEAFNSVSLAEQAKAVNAVVRRHTLRNSVLVFIHQDYYPSLCQREQGKHDTNEYDRQWIEQVRVLSAHLPPVILVSPCSDQDVTTERL
jgi:hypothetical protein